MFYPNLTCTIWPVSDNNEYGEKELGSPREAGCAIIYYRDQIGETSVRADSTASRGNARQSEIDVRLLVESHSVLKKGEIVQIHGFDEKLEVDRAFPRHGFGGEIHHYQVDLRIWRL